MKYFRSHGPQVLALWVGREMISRTRRLFPEYAIREPPPNYQVDPDRFDGVVLVPSYQGERDYPAWLSRVYLACQEEIVTKGFKMPHYLGAFESSRIQRIHEGGSTTGSPLICTPLRFQLGGRYLGLGTTKALPQIRARHEQPLELGAALLAITHLICRDQIRRPFRVECPGTHFSPKQDGRYDDVTRIDVMPRIDGDPGEVSVDWNWNTRNRDNTGAGSSDDSMG